MWGTYQIMCRNEIQPSLPLDGVVQKTESGLDWVRLRHSIETLLFVAAEPLTNTQLAEIIGVKPKEVDVAAQELMAEYEGEGRGILIRRVAGGWQFVTAPDFSALVEKLYRPKYHQLSNAAMETLAIVAYKQPITRAEVSEIRQVDSDGVFSTLLEKHLITEVGRLAGPGRAILYGTSDTFLTFFGINSLSELPVLCCDDQVSGNCLIK